MRYDLPKRGILLALGATQIIALAQGGGWSPTLGNLVVLQG